MMYGWTVCALGCCAGECRGLQGLYMSVTGASEGVAGGYWGCRDRVGCGVCCAVHKVVWVNAKCSLGLCVVVCLCQCVCMRAYACGCVRIHGSCCCMFVCGCCCVWLCGCACACVRAWCLALPPQAHTAAAQDAQLVEPNSDDGGVLVVRAAGGAAPSTRRCALSRGPGEGDRLREQAPAETPALGQARSRRSVCGPRQYLTARVNVA